MCCIASSLLISHIPPTEVQKHHPLSLCSLARLAFAFVNVNVSAIVNFDKRRRPTALPFLYPVTLYTVCNRRWLDTTITDPPKVVSRTSSPSNFRTSSNFASILESTAGCTALHWHKTADLAPHNLLETPKHHGSNDCATSHQARVHSHPHHCDHWRALLSLKRFIQFLLALDTNSTTSVRQIICPI